LLHLDYETSSEVDLKKSGLHNYTIHPSTKVLMLAWAFGDDEPVLWLPHQDLMPRVLLDAFNNPSIDLTAFSSPFERGITRDVLGIDIPIERWQDPQASARYLSLPAHLADVCKVLGLPREFRKDDAGKDLIKLFSLPHTRTKKEGGGTYFNTWETHPTQFAHFGLYCLQDVRAEREVIRREKLLGAFPLPPRERKIWIFDQKVNDRGMPVDRKFVENAFALASKNKDEKLEEQNTATGLKNANSQKQLLPWIKERGWPLSNIRKQNIDLVLKDPEVELTDECRQVLTARTEAGSISYKKLESILSNISPDDRLRNQFIYMGSARCGRWAGNAVQLHNMARPDGTFEDLENVEKARHLIYCDEYVALKSAFQKKDGTNYSPLIIIKNLIRTVFVAPEGKRFNVCDLNAIETRVGAWVAQCQALLDVFVRGEDPYLSFAVKLTGIPYEKLLYDLKKNPDKIAKAFAKLQRQFAKPGVLGAIYRLSGGGWGHDKNGDNIKTGLWGYAEGMGIDITQEQSAQIVKIFRDSYPEICSPPYEDYAGGIWYTLEAAVMDVLRGVKTVRKIGPDGCIVMDKVTIAGRDPMFRIKLPSGRYLHYLDASIQWCRMPWTKKRWETNALGETVLIEEPVHKEAFTYYGMDQTTKNWDMIVSHGGKIFENIVQAIARDVLADKLLEFEEAGFETVGHVHDEGICLSPVNYVIGVKNMEAIMNTPVVWAPTLPLGSDGFESSFYHK
jgi:DNA polymerase bacteriophage-type